MQLDNKTNYTYTNDFHKIRVLAQSRLPLLLGMVILPLQLQPFHSIKKKKNTHHPQQELGGDKILLKFRLWSCSQKLCRISLTKSINFYQPIFKAPFINMWTLKFKLQSLVLYCLLLSTTSKRGKGPCGTLLLANFNPICQSTFVSVHPLLESI